MKEKMKRYGSKSESASRKKSHKGNPKAHTGFGFPQRLREREREKDREKNVADEHTKHKDRERGPQTSGQTRVRSLSAKKPDNNPTPETKNTTQNTQHPSQRNLTKTRYKTNKVSEDLSPQGGGAHGPPCTLGESPQGTAIPRGTSTPPLREPPPVAQKADTYPTQDKYPKSLVPALGRSDIAQQDRK